MCTEGIRDQVSVDTLARPLVDTQHLIDISNDTWSTLDQHSINISTTLNRQSVESWSSVDWLTCIDWHLMVCLQILDDSDRPSTEMLMDRCLSIDRDVYGVLIKCWSSVDQVLIDCWSNVNWDVDEESIEGQLIDRHWTTDAFSTVHDANKLNLIFGVTCRVHIL